MTKQEKQEFLKLTSGQWLLNNSYFWDDPEEKTYLKGLWLVSHHDKVLNLTELLPELNKSFKFVSGGAVMLKRISEYKDFRIEVLETIKRIKGGTYDK